MGKNLQLNINNDIDKDDNANTKIMSTPWILDLQCVKVYMNMVDVADAKGYQGNRKKNAIVRESVEKVEWEV